MSPRTERLQVSAFIGKDLLDYYSQRRLGLIPQNEDPQWGRRQSDDWPVMTTPLDIMQGFYEVKWNEGYTGRGVDARSYETFGGHEPVGPMDETVEYGKNDELVTVAPKISHSQVTENDSDGGSDALTQDVHTQTSEHDEEYQTIDMGRECSESEYLTSTETSRPSSDYASPSSSFGKEDSFEQSAQKALAMLSEIEARIKEIFQGSARQDKTRENRCIRGQKRSLESVESSDEDGDSERSPKHKRLN